MNSLEYLKALKEFLETVSPLGQPYPTGQPIHGGGPLQIEDLNVTMQCRTFTCPQWGTRHQVAKIVKQLIRRRIPYTLSERVDAFKQPELSLTVGDRLLIYIVERA